VLSAESTAELGERLAAVHSDFRAAGAVRSARKLESVVAAVAAAHLLLLSRRLEPRGSAALALVLEDEERRSLRALLRVSSSRASAPPPALLPTPRLTPARLEELAGARGPAELVGRLSRLGHPWAPALHEPAQADPPDLFALELALDRVFFEGGLRDARRGGRALLRHARRLVDAANARAALTLAGRGGSVGRQAFLEGGAALSREEFERVLAAPERVRAAAELARALEGEPIARAFEPGEPAGLERRLLESLLEGLRRERRLDPLGPAGLLLHALRLRALLVDLRRRGWELALQCAAEGAG
jgi:hypothetical protein